MKLDNETMIYCGLRYWITQLELSEYEKNDEKQKLISDLKELASAVLVSRVEIKPIKPIDSIYAGVSISARLGECARVVSKAI